MSIEDILKTIKPGHNYDVCPVCNGSGKEPLIDLTCRMCMGMGKTPIDDDN